MFGISKEDNEQFELEILCGKANDIKLMIDGLTKDKTDIEDSIRELLNHSSARDGAETYKRGVCKIQVTTGLNYRVDASVYEACRDGLNPSINPVSEKTTYTINKKKLETMHEFGTDDELDLLEKIILTSPKKPSIKIEISKDHL
jgi:hypothetical protein